MVQTIHDILVRLRLLDEITKPLKKHKTIMSGLKDKQQELVKMGQRMTRQQVLVNKMMMGGAGDLVDNAKRTNKLVKENDSFRKVMGMNFPLWKKINEQGGQFNTIGGRVANRTRKMTHGLRGFRMEMLSVMFFGMGMTKFFKGLITPALQMVGVFDVFKTALAILFLPIAFKLLDWALLFMDWVLEMSPGLQTLINWFVAIGYALGTFLFLLGMGALGIGGIIVVFGGMFAVILSIILSVLKLATSWKMWIAALLGFGLAAKAVSAFGGAIEKAKGWVAGLLDKMIQLDFVQDILERLGIEGQTFAEVWKNIVGKITGYFEDLPEDIKYWLGYARIIIITQFNQIKNKIEDFIKTLTGEDGVVSGFKELADTLMEVDWVPFIDLLNDVVWLLDKAALALAKYISLFKAAQVTGGVFAEYMGYAAPERQMGGYIPHTGLYQLHAGETVVPAGAMTSSPTIIVNPSSGMDEEALARRISEVVVRDFEGLSRR